MPEAFDVFVSYSRLDAYRPGGVHAGARDPWIGLFRTSLEQLLADQRAADGKAHRQPSIYVYEERDIGEVWPANVGSACRSKVLLAIVSETYFRSKTCFLEWHAFVTGNPEFGRFTPVPPHRTFKVAPVWRLEDPDANLDGEVKAALLEDALASIKRAFADDEAGGFTPDRIDELVRAWTKMIFDANAEDLSEYAFASERQWKRGPLRRQMEHIAKSMASQLAGGGVLPSQEEYKLLALSVLALGLDRYNSGGWGFSMGAEFERDVDSRLLTHGRYELNLLVLRALHWFADEACYLKENQAALLWSLEPGLPDIAGSPVTDRKRRAVALNSLLRWGGEDRDVRDLLVRNVTALEEVIDHKPFYQRWVVEQNVSASDFDTVVFFELAARSKSASSKIAFLRDSLTGIKDAYEEAKKALRQWLYDDHHLLARLRDGFFLPLAEPNTVTSISGGTVTNPNLPSRLTVYGLSLSLRILSDIKDSAVILAAAPETSPAISAIEDSIEKIVYRLKASDRDDAELRTFMQVFPLYCLSMMDIAFHYRDSAAIQEHAKRCQNHWADLIQCIGAGRIVRNMNAAGWAAALLLAERRELSIDRTLLKAVWSAAETARGARKNVVLDAVKAAPATARQSFDAFVTAEVKALEARLGMELADPAQLRPLFSFGGNGRGRQADGPIHLGEAAGLLMVDAKTDQVLSATAGFNAMYIEPFSARLGIGFNSLERMIYELGETDRQFVEALSHSVVIHCWPIDKIPKGKIQAVRFDERTQAVQQNVIGGEPGQSRRDLLELRTGSDDATRYVLRTCSTVHREDLIGVAPANLVEDGSANKRLVLWTFVDVSGWIAEDTLGLADRLAV